MSVDLSEEVPVPQENDHESKEVRVAEENDRAIGFEDVLTPVIVGNLHQYLDDKDFLSLATCSKRTRYEANHYWKMRARKRAKHDFVFKSLWKHSYSDSNCSKSEALSFAEIYGNCDKKVNLVKTKKSIYRYHKYDKIRTNPNVYRHQMVVTKRYICTVSEDFDFSYIAINDRVTMEQVGYLETPHVGEWGYDYEIDGIYEDDILVTRACGPPHEIRFWGLENIVTMEVGDIQPLKEIIIDSGPLWVDNEALNVNISKNFIQCTPCDYPDEIYSIQKGQNYFKKLDLPQDKPENEAQEYYHQKISDNHLLVWNTSRQIGGWISTAFTEPQRYFLRLYRFQNVNSAAPALERLSDLDLPRGQIHGELLSHQIYESKEGVFLIAKDGHRVRDSNKLFDREMHSSRVHVINLLTGVLIWSGPIFSNGSFNSCGIYPKLSHGIFWASWEVNHYLKKLIIWDIDGIIKSKETETPSPVVLHGIEDFQIDDVHLGLVRVCDNQVFFFDKDGILHCFNFLEPYLF